MPSEISNDQTKMNDQERERSGDGAGPKWFAEKTDHRFPLISVAHSHTNSHLLLCGIIMLLVLLCSLPCSLMAQKSSRATLKGLSLHINAGVLCTNDKTANFYNGNPRNANTLERILYSETYGNQIWNDLTEQDLIGSAISNYNQITVAEYGDMSYNIAFQLGLGFRYDLIGNDWAWQICFDYAKLNAQGMVLLNSGKNLSILTNQNAYVNCPTSGLEERIYIDLGFIRKFRLNNGLDFEAQIGANVNNTKVESSDIRIAGRTYSILDVWGGEHPSSYVGSYEYVNQGGIGYGGYASLAIGFTIPAGTAMQLAYTFHYNKTTLEGYSSFAPHHAISLNVYVNNFSFFD